MGVSVTNLTQGPGTLYTAAVGVTEPADTAVSSAPGVGYTDVGGTSDGVTLSINQSYKELEVDQVVDIPGRRITKREMTLKTNMAEPTLENLAIALNADASQVVSSGTAGTSNKVFTPNNETSATQPKYKALLFDGFAPGSDASGTSPRRRVLVRRALSTDNVQFTYKKDDQTVFSTEFSAHYVSSAITPFKIVDQVLAA